MTVCLPVVPPVPAMGLGTLHPNLPFPAAGLQTTQTKTKGDGPPNPHRDRRSKPGNGLKQNTNNKKAGPYASTHTDV